MKNVAFDLIDTQKKASVSSLFSMLSRHETVSRERINLIASENVLSPFAKLPFLLDAHSRYFLDDFRRFGKWFFPGGEQMGEIEQQVLNPLLCELAEASYVNSRPISGMNCMLVALAAFTRPGDVIFTIPVENGGHVSTAVVAKTLGVEMYTIPFLNAFDVDYDCLEAMIIKKRPALIYIDQATMLFPIDPYLMRKIMDAVSPETILHYDSSHTNGLIFGKAMFNPLQRGAHCYGGSTHKTLPGPHKGFLATNDKDIAQRIEEKANHLVSHHHTSSGLSLAITLMEMKWCQGEDYARQVILNTKAFARALEKQGFLVAAQDRDYTACHQTWMHLLSAQDTEPFVDLLTHSGIMVTRFDGLPGIAQPAFRLSFAELTRLGASVKEADSLAEMMANLLKNPHKCHDTVHDIRALRRQFSTPKFCLELSDVEDGILSPDLKSLCERL